MREIIFRGKDKFDGEWYVGSLSHDTKYGNCFIEVSVHQGIAKEVIPETVGQYTGLTDKNGVKVFEGDIVRIFDGEYFSGVIKYSNEQGSFTVDDTSLHYWISDIEVIGNIHDNSELLNE